MTPELHGLRMVSLIKSPSALLLPYAAAGDYLSRLLEPPGLESAGATAWHSARIAERPITQLSPLVEATLSQLVPISQALAILARMVALSVLR